MEKNIAYLDILGFKEIVKEKNQIELISLIKGLVQNFDNDPQAKYYDVNFLSISDAVIFWAESAMLFDLFRAVRRFLFQSIRTGIPMRGAITRGEFDFIKVSSSDTPRIKSQYSAIGKGLVEAYLMERQQEWAGCVVDPKVFDSKEPPNVFFADGGLDRGKMLVKWQIPLKKSGPVSNKATALNWPGVNYESPPHVPAIRSGEHLKQLLKQNLKGKGKRIDKKIQNTIDFFVKNSALPVTK